MERVNPLQAVLIFMLIVLVLLLCNILSLRRVFKRGEYFGEEVELPFNVFVVLHIEWVVQFEFCHEIPIITHILNVYKLEGWNGLSREKLNFRTLRLGFFSRWPCINFRRFHFIISNSS